MPQIIKIIYTWIKVWESTLIYDKSHAFYLAGYCATIFLFNKIRTISQNSFEKDLHYATMP